MAKGHGAHGEGGCQRISPHTLPGLASDIDPIAEAWRAHKSPYEATIACILAISTASRVDGLNLRNPSVAVTEF